MRIFIRTIVSSLAQAWQQLTGNKLRTALSLLGVSIGIFCIVAVQAAVDSLQNNVVSSLSKLGDQTYYIDKWPWGGGGGEYPWWKYNRRPYPTYDEYEALRETFGEQGEAGYYSIVAGRTMRWRSNSLQGVFSVAGSKEMPDFFGFEFDDGRFFNDSEYRAGSNVIVLGHTIAADLFGSVSPVGREVRMFGQKLLVVGVLEKAGEDLLQVFNFDETAILPYPFMAKAVNLESSFFRTTLMARPTEQGFTKQELRDEITMTLRAERRLRPTEEEDFAINSISILTGFLDNIFGVLNTVGLFVGFFAILVGGFSVANIMFVSVQERTNLIGVKMALGAKRPVILLEFLIESVALCLIGGLCGLGLVVAAILALNTVLPFPIALSAGNIWLGLGLALMIGLCAGVIPANQASKMDPVAAIRS